MPHGGITVLVTGSLRKTAVYQHEPLRPDTPGIERSRSLVGVASLDDLFWESFVGGIVYVLEGGRYLYPGTIEVYNALAARRAEGRP